MAYLNNYLTELSIGDNANLEKIFNLALSQVFSPLYLNKIETIIKKKISIKEKVNNNQNIVAWTEGTTIYVNRPEFYARDMKSRIKYILHEFMHVLNNSKSFLVLNKFKEIIDLSNELWGIIKTHTKDIGKFLTSKTISQSLLNNQESLSYLMNDAIDWRQITPEGRKLFIKALNDSGIFNLQHAFWKKRLQ